MKTKLIGEYKEAYKQIQKRIMKEQLHPLSLKEARTELIQYLEDWQNKKKKLEDYESIEKDILIGKLYQTRKTHILLWISLTFFILFLISGTHIGMSLFLNESCLSLTDIVLVFYISFIVMKGVPDKFVLLVVFSGIPLAFATVMIERYFMVDFTHINLYMAAIVCFLISGAAYYFVKKEYTDWKRNQRK